MNPETTCTRCGETLRSVYAVYDGQMRLWHASCLEAQRFADTAEAVSICRWIIRTRRRAA